MKNFNLTQMLQGCSRSNEMTVSASNSGGGKTCQVKQQTRRTSVEEKWSEKEALSSTCLRSASDALSFRSRYLRYAAMIFCILVMSVANIDMAWGTDYYLRYMKSMPAGTSSKCFLYQVWPQLVSVSLSFSPPSLNDGVIACSLASQA